MLQKMLVEQTKSRARHSNDNGLVEGKNNAIVRKTFGYIHIPKKFAELMNTFNKKFFNPYINFHRQCAFATDTVDAKGKVKKKYGTHLTPFEKLASLPNAEQYLKPGMTLARLRRIEQEYDDITFAELKEQERSKLFKSLS